MYAIVEIAGQQFKVEKDKKIFVHRLKQNEGDSLEFEKVLLVDNEGKVKIGAPVLEGAKITAKVLEHVRGEKVKIFKKKRRKGYQKLSGHRQDFTQIEIESITI
jgi:large subunit ribosomal protein L21